MGEYFFDTEFFIDESTKSRGKMYHVLVIYDIVCNKRRVKLAKLMESFGFRVQKSAFEADLSESKYEKMIRLIKKHIHHTEDSVRIYKIQGTGQVTIFGDDSSFHLETTIII